MTRLGSAIKTTPFGVWACYALLWWAIAPFYLLRVFWRSRHEPLYRVAWPERLARGLHYQKPWHNPHPLIWIHAVSLGETRALPPLLVQLRQQWPEYRLLITSTTATGRLAAQALLQSGDKACWLPMDTSGAMQRFMRRWQPVMGLLMETEIWPQLMRAAQRNGIPMVLVNARLSQRSLRKGLRFQALLQPAMAALRLSLAQTQADAERLRLAGAGLVQVCGNLKFDVALDPNLQARGKAWRACLQPARAVWMAASWREEEDDMLLQAWRALPQPRPLLLWVPRHPQRFDVVAQKIQAQGWSLARRSHWQQGPQPGDAQADVWLGDSVGEMQAYYALAQWALLGGSFAPLGGQNLIEAIACGCPVVMGPHTFNFEEAAQMAEAAGVAQRADTVADALRCLVTESAFNHVPTAQAPTPLPQRCAEFAQAHAGAARRIVVYL
jgi:3-deoxy-D-manno-octulosonic-acid transferase